jgi:PPP family 3-phenylpropionic acid transporter
LKISNISKAGYGKIRLWGSVGFIFSVLAMGALFDLISIQYFPLLVLMFALVAWLGVVFLKEQRVKSEVEWTDKFWKIIKEPCVIALLFVSLLVQFSHGSYYGFYSIFLSDAGYSKTWIAAFWAIGVIAEIVVFLYMVPLFKHQSAKWLLMLSLWLTLIRWVLIPLVVESLALLFLAQLLHAASYGLFHAAAIYLIDDIFTGKNQSRGQAVYASVSHGLGGSLGLLLAGYVWFGYGANVSFYINAVLVVFALVIAYKWVFQNK